jgi:hypothetical protein
MAHVEIFLGGETGEATLAARYARGVVSVFPSYKFHSSLWTLDKHYFCSIETWLNGECITQNPLPPPDAARAGQQKSPLAKMRF